MYKFLAWLLYIPLWLLSLLPLRVHYLLADIIAWLLRDVAKYRQRVIDKNLSAAFPEMEEDEKRRLRRDYYAWLGDVVVEMVWSLTRSGEHIRRRGFYSIDPESERVMNEAYSNAPSVMALLAHTGNWELASDVPFYMAHPAFGSADMTVTYQTLHNPLSEELFKLLRRARLKKAESLVASHKVLRFMLEHKAEQRIYFFVADQRPVGVSSQSATFMGQDTQWSDGGEAIARKLHLPVLYVYLDRLKRGEYVIKISQICSDASLLARGEVVAAYAARLQEDIMARKYNWLWSHRRWKGIINY